MPTARDVMRQELTVGTTITRSPLRQTLGGGAGEGAQLAIVGGLLSPVRWHVRSCAAIAYSSVDSVRGDQHSICRRSDPTTREPRPCRRTCTNSSPRPAADRPAACRRPRGWSPSPTAPPAGSCVEFGGSTARHRSARPASRSASCRGCRVGPRLRRSWPDPPHRSHRRTRPRSVRARRHGQRPAGRRSALRPGVPRGSKCPTGPPHPPLRTTCRVCA